jgi:hypothetical protein
MNAEERKCIKAACTHLRKTAAAHDDLETQHCDEGNDHFADCHKAAAAGLRDGCTQLEKMAALPVGSAGGDGHASTIETNADGDSQAKRSTEEIDRVLQEDRSDEFGKAVPADPSAELVADLNL